MLKNVNAVCALILSVVGITALAFSLLAMQPQPAVAEYYTNTAPTFGFKNKVINGDFMVWQRGSPVVALNAYGPDRFLWTAGGDPAFNFVQSTDVPTVAQSGNYSSFSCYMDCTTGDAGPLGNNEYGAVRYVMEGQDWAALAQRGFTVSFWTKATVNGIYCFSVNNGASGTPDRAFMCNYTVTSSGTWQKQSIYVPPSPSAGTWDYGNGTGARFYWTLYGAVSGSGIYSGTANPGAWQTVSNYLLHSTSQVNAASSNLNEWRIAQIQIEAGSMATPFERRPIAAELAMCHRYTYVISGAEGYYNGSNTFRTAGNSVVAWFTPPQEMRITPTAVTHNITGWATAAPTTTLIANNDIAANGYTTITSGVFSSFTGTGYSRRAVFFAANCSVTFSGNSGTPGYFLIGPDVRIVISAEL